ncbi:hypothetical protein ATM97_24745 [Nocardia sp. MH4]|nr:hypothetical protein [Nocardia sp. MH4]
MPGDTAQADTLSTRVRAATDAVTEAKSLLTRLRNSNDEVWNDGVGDAFRASSRPWTSPLPEHHWSR